MPHETCFAAMQNWQLLSPTDVMLHGARITGFASATESLSKPKSSMTNHHWSEGQRAWLASSTRLYILIRSADTEASLLPRES